MISNGITIIGKKEAKQIKEEYSELVLPTTLKSIGESAFEYNILLKSVQFPDGLEEIGARAFFFCDELEKVTIPGTVTYIEEEAFKGCKRLNCVTLNYGVKAIKASAFDACPELKSIDIPSTVTEFGWHAFHKGTLENLFLSAGPSQYDALVRSFGSGLFGGGSEERVQLFHTLASVKEEINITLHVPQGTEMDYKRHPFFGKFVNIVTR